MAQPLKHKDNYGHFLHEIEGTNYKYTVQRSLFFNLYLSLFDDIYF